MVSRNSFSVDMLNILLIKITVLSERQQLTSFTEHTGKLMNQQISFCKCWYKRCFNSNTLTNVTYFKNNVIYLLSIYLLLLQVCSSYIPHPLDHQVCKSWWSLFFVQPADYSVTKSCCPRSTGSPENHKLFQLTPEFPSDIQ